MGERARTDDTLRRYALQITQQFPENREDALALLRYIGELIEWEHGGCAAGRVVPLRPAG